MIRLLLVCIFFWMTTTSAQVLTYTETETGADKIPLGFPVPLPIDSLTPVDGFRTYQSLNLRHEQLTQLSENIEQYQIGQTMKGRPIWAYAISDENLVTENSISEASALINGGIHAREWQSPEVLTGYMEMLFEREDDNYLGQYLIENLQLVLIPVLNVDGFLQTQRFPTQVTSSEETPRDGRMRRKNMRGVDTQLTTGFDNLKGIDLNRNNNPYWATSTGSSDDVDSLIYHGQAPTSESEIEALQEAAVVSGEDRLRFYLDTHSFSQIYLTPLTDNIRRNRITSHLAKVMRGVNNNKYRYSTSLSGAGIGTTVEYFAETYEIPSYTLELEPENSARDYGAIAGGHSGFILPNSEVGRMRNEKNDALLVGLYAIAQKPYIKRIEIIDPETDATVLAKEWQFKDSGGSLVTLTDGELSASTPYYLNIVFNKPMRWLENGEVEDFATLSDALDIDLVLLGVSSAEQSSWVIDAENGDWLLEGYYRYKTDTFSVPFQLTDDFVWSSYSYLAFEVATQDFSGSKLDTNPATQVDWADGAWTNYEDSNGDSTTDSGGIDRSLRLIDDDSPLYSDEDEEPVAMPVPPASTDNTSSGGVVGGIWLITLLLVVLGRRPEFSPKK